MPYKTLKCDSLSNLFRWRSLLSFGHTHRFPSAFSSCLWWRRLDHNCYMMLHQDSFQWRLWLFGKPFYPNASLDYEGQKMFCHSAHKYWRYQPSKRREIDKLDCYIFLPIVQLIVQKSGKESKQSRTHTHHADMQEQTRMLTRSRNSKGILEEVANLQVPYYVQICMWS